MGRVIVESPYAGDIERNKEYVRMACRDCILRGEVPFASHVFFTEFLDDTIPDERQLGIEMGYDFWEKADKVVFYTDLGMSPGMQAALTKAFLEGKPYEKRSLPLKMLGPILGPTDLDVDMEQLEGELSAEDKHE